MLPSFYFTSREKGTCDVTERAAMVTTMILGVASLAQAVTGFGFSLLAVPLLAMIVGPVDAVVGSSMVVLPLNAVIMLRDRTSVEWKIAGNVLVAGLLGLPVGLVVLRLVPSRFLSGFISVVVLGATFAIWKGMRIQPNRTSIAAVGLVSGILTTATGINGPPLAATFSAMDLHPRRFRATMATIFVTIGLAGLMGFIVTSQMSTSSLHLFLMGVPAVAAGWYLGDLVFSRIADTAIFRTVVLCSLAAISGMTLAKVFIA
jgi:uncharacterized membrane protein YfcA